MLVKSKPLLFNRDLIELGKLVAFATGHFYTPLFILKSTDTCTLKKEVPFNNQLSKISLAVFDLLKI